MNLILVEKQERIAVVTLNRPEKLNAFAGTMREDLIASLQDVAEDSKVRAVIITGAGRAFCAGGDVAAMAALQREDRTEDFRRLLDAGARIVTLVRAMPKIVIAAVNGVAAGAGCNLALSCDYRIAADSAKFSQAFVKIGLHPDWGGSWLLPKLVGPSKAIEILATGRMVDSEEALSSGMIDCVVDRDSLMDEARALASRIASGPAGAIADIKRSVWTAMTSDLRGHLAVETDNQLRAFSTADGREGVTAFLEKRSPEFE